MSASYAVLGMLGRSPAYGYSLKKDYDALYGGHRPLAFGQIYATLSRFVRDRKVVVATAEGQGRGPRRKLYRITPRGRADLEAWLLQPVDMPAQSAYDFYVKVATAVLLAKDSHPYIDLQRAAMMDRMRQLTRVRQQDNLVQRLQADFALFHLEANLRWVDATIARIEDIKKEVTAREG